MDNITASGAEKIQKEDIAFTSSAHEKFYYEKLKETRCQDVYHKALCYCLGICDDTRKNIYNIYDFKTGSIKTWRWCVWHLTFTVMGHQVFLITGIRKDRLMSAGNIQWRICPAVYMQVQ